MKFLSKPIGFSVASILGLSFTLNASAEEATQWVRCISVISAPILDPAQNPEDDIHPGITKIPDQLQLGSYRSQYPELKKLPGWKDNKSVSDKIKTAAGYIVSNNNDWLKITGHWKPEGESGSKINSYTITNFLANDFNSYLYIGSGEKTSARINYDRQTGTVKDSVDISSMNELQEVCADLISKDEISKLAYIKSNAEPAIFNNINKTFMNNFNTKNKSYEPIKLDFQRIQSYSDPAVPLISKYKENEAKTVYMNILPVAQHNTTSYNEWPITDKINKDFSTGPDGNGILAKNKAKYDTTKCTNNNKPLDQLDCAKQFIHYENIKMYMEAAEFSYNFINYKDGKIDGNRNFKDSFKLSSSNEGHKNVNDNFTAMMNYSKNNYTKLPNCENANKNAECIYYKTILDNQTYVLDYGVSTINSATAQYTGEGYTSVGKNATYGDLKNTIKYLPNDYVANESNFPRAELKQSYGYYYVDKLKDFEVVASLMGAGVSNTYAAALYNKQLNLLIISYKGTATAQDFSTDLNLMLMNYFTNQQYINDAIYESTKFYFEVINSFKDKPQIVLTGHSLGGFLANMVAFKTGAHARVFSSPADYISMSKGNPLATLFTILNNNYIPSPTVINFARLSDPVTILSGRHISSQILFNSTNILDNLKTAKDNTQKYLTSKFLNTTNLNPANHDVRQFINLVDLAIDSESKPSSTDIGQMYYDWATPRYISLRPDTILMNANDILMQDIVYEGQFSLDVSTLLVKKPNTIINYWKSLFGK